jgi:uncharacterized Zn-binding protein involved in type VI secretion
MPGIALVGKDTAGGTQLGGGQGFFKVDGAPVVLVGDAIAGHGKSPHSAPVMVAGADWFRINGKPVCRAGDPASCGHASTGQSWFRIG